MAGRMSGALSKSQSAEDASETCLDGRRQCSSAIRLTALPPAATHAPETCASSLGCTHERDYPTPGSKERIHRCGTLCAQLIIKTGGSTMTACNDQPTAANPTCGWAVDQSGARIPASQGFCCSCTSSQLLAATVKGSSAGALCDQLFYQVQSPVPLSTHPTHISITGSETIQARGAALAHAGTKCSFAVSRNNTSLVV